MKYTEPRSIACYLLCGLLVLAAAVQAHAAWPHKRRCLFRRSWICGRICHTRGNQYDYRNGTHQASASTPTPPDRLSSDTLRRIDRAAQRLKEFRWEVYRGSGEIDLIGQRVVQFEHMRPNAVTGIGRFFPLEGDPPIAELSKLHELQVLMELSATCGNEVVQSLPPDAPLRIVLLPDTAITDDGVKALARFRTLEFLDLSRTKITDASIPELSKLKSLRYLFLYGTEVTTQGRERLARQLPNCELPTDHIPYKT